MDTVSEALPPSEKTESSASPRNLKISAAIKAAIQNITAFGDTDIFPFSFEQHIFHDRPDLLQTALEEIHINFDRELARNPPDNINTLAPVGYTGFRWATQIDPIWNAYYLSLVIEMGPAIEAARIPVIEECVFSYRFTSPTPEGRIFDEDVSWRNFLETSAKAAEEFQFVIVCDISDFYSRVYHHRIENALKWLNKDADTVRRITEILKVFSGTVSYGLPVGGSASRLLAELALNSVDRLLRGEGVRFCRFVDDYRIFCRSKEEAYQRLILLSEKLFNEGLSLQKNKTRIITTKEFADEISFLLRVEQTEDQNLTEEHKLLSLTIHYDPYSDTRVDDYRELKDQISRVDIAGILSRELEKTRIDSSVTKQAISALRILDAGPRNEILSLLLKPENLLTLSPVFSRIMMVLRGLYSELDPATQDLVSVALVGLIEQESHIIKVDLNLAYVVQVLRRRCTHQIETLFVRLFKTTTSSLVRREIILAWVDWGHNHCLTDIKKHFQALSKWERRAFIVGSYMLRDEGKHWREHNAASFDPSERIVRQWFADRVQKNPKAPL